MADENAKELADREDRAFKAKQNLDALHQELALNFYPERADFTSQTCLGEEFAVDLFDSEPLRCRRDLANARASMLRPRGQEWARAETGNKKLDERPNIARFFDAMNDEARALIYHPTSGFSRATKEADNDIVVFGQSIVTVESEIGRDGERRLMIRSWHPRDCAWYDDQTGVRPDVFFRRFRMSARHIVTKFKDGQIHESIRRAADKEPDREFKLCHVMMPADEYEWYKRPGEGRNAPFASIYYDSEHKMLLREGASQRFRYVLDRWATLQGSQYGYSPAAMTSLPDARGMQAVARVLLEASEKELDPPMKATEGSVKSDIDVSASGITWVDKAYDERMGPAIERLYPPGRNLPIGIDIINRTVLAMRDTWFLSNLKLPQQAKTAFETQALLEEFIRANIPLFEPWEAGTALLLDEIYNVLIDTNAFVPALGPVSGWPRELSDRDLAFSFSNPLQDAIERNRVNQAQQVLGIVAGAVQADPQAGAQHAVNLVKIVQDATRGTGAPADWVHDDDTTQQAVADNAKTGNILNALSMADQAAGVVKTGSEAAANLQQINQAGAGGQITYGPS